MDSSTAGFAWAHSYGCVHPGRQLGCKVQDSLTCLFGSGSWLLAGAPGFSMWSLILQDIALASFHSWALGSIPRLWKQKWQGLLRPRFGRHIMSLQLQSFDRAVPKMSPAVRDWEADSFSEREEQQRRFAKSGKKPWPQCVICGCIGAS